MFTIDQSVRPLDPRTDSDYWVIHTTETWLMAGHKPDVSWELHMHVNAPTCLFLLRASEARNCASVMCDFQTRLARIRALQRQVSSLQLSAAAQEDKPEHAKL